MFGRHAMAVAGLLDYGFKMLRFDAARQVRRDSRQLQLYFRRSSRLARVAPGEDDVLHPVATQAFRALFPQHPRDGVDDVALAATVGTDDGGDALVEGQLGAIWESS